MPGRPDGAPQRIDFGTLSWGAEATQTIKLTWRDLAPYDISVETPAPLRADVTASKALPGRFVIVISVDWDSDELSGGATVRGHTFTGTVVVRWPNGEASIPVSGVVLYPAVVTASPAELDLGTMDAQSNAHIALVLVSSAATSVELDPPAWLAPVDAAGAVRPASIRLETNVPMRVELGVRWAPILERAQASFAERRSVRPTGKITVRWNDRSLDVPVQMVVRAPRR